ncbi:hypothetical protein ACOMCU_27470 [Lysinibacillus sp. UGB7]|uniref:hypothetical protein n=1 Tax=Lysinibacillus sp. UGB7 TaxID=3411039 RepID=UPI003B8025FC
MAKKGKGFFGSIGSFLGSIPAVGKVKNAAKSVKKKIKNTKKKLKKAIKKAKKKLKKKLKKKIGKVFTKARKLKNNLSKSKMVKKFKRTAKKVVLAAKQAAKKTYTKVKQAVKEVKAKVKKAVVVYKSLDKIEPPKPTKDMSTKERLLLAGMEIGLHKAQKYKGMLDATIDVGKSTLEGLWGFANNPIGGLKDSYNNLVGAVFHPIETTKAIGNSIQNSSEKNIINGNAYSRSYLGTKATLNTAIAFVGTKGAGSLTKVGKVPKGGTEIVNKEQILKNLDESKKARESSNFSEYTKKEKEILENKANNDVIFATSNLIKDGKISADDLKSMIPNDTPNTFNPSETIAEGYKYKFEIDGQKVEFKWHSPDLNAKQLYPDSNSGNMWTAQIKIGKKLLGEDGKLYKKPNNLTHIPIE